MVEAGAWNDLLPKHHQQEWIRWFQELTDLELVTIPRCLKDSETKVVELRIHTFTDASESTYAAALYARHVYENGDVTVRLIATKSRLAPLKAVSIPRLLGALIGTRLTMQICSALKISTHSDILGGQCKHGILDPKSKQRIQAVRSSSSGRDPGVFSSKSVMLYTH